MNTLAEHTWRKALLAEDATVQEAVQCLNESSLQIALVISREGCLIGTLTDGDIRRGLLQGVDLTSKIDSIIHRDAFVVPPQMGRNSVLQLMQANKILQLPIVDTEKRVVGLHVWDELTETESRQNVMVIMAGGKGTRLRPHTENCPKPLLPLAGRPMLEHIIERARASGFLHFILSTHYMGQMIEEYFGDGSRWQVRIDYIKEKTPLGTAGALSLLKQKPKQPLVISNGDVITDIHYGELVDFHNRYEAWATMAVQLHEWQHPFGVVQIRGVDIVGFEEKPVARTHINAGIYTLSPEALYVLKKGEPCDMPTLFERLHEDGKRIVAYPIHEPWLDIGRIEEFERAEKDVEECQDSGNRAVY